MTRRSLLRTAALGAAAAVVLQGVQWLRVFRYEYDSYCPPRQRIETAALRGRIPALESVSWAGPVGPLHGWFVPGRERAAVILLHGSLGSRNELAEETTFLARRGFSVLALDWPGHGESAGCASWGHSERATLDSALGWLARRPETRGVPVGALGVSAGTYPLVQQAARDPRIRAVTLAGPVGDMRTFVRWEYRSASLGLLAYWPALVAARLRGMRVDEQVPDAVVGRIAPRPLLVVLGTEDHVLPRDDVMTLYRQAGAPKELLLLPGAGHGGYAASAPALYPARVTDFFVRALLSRPAAGTSE